MYGDTTVIRRLARDLAEQAEEIRRRADELVRASERVLWDGRAAVAMRERMVGRAVALRRTADQHEDAARALRTHAEEVDRLKEAISRIAARVGAMIEGAKSRIAELADKVLPDAVDSVLASFKPPPSGHLDWLSVPDRIPGVRR